MFEQGPAQATMSLLRKPAILAGLAQRIFNSLRIWTVNQQVADVSGEN